ncbi:MAG: hypothetical protein GX459_11995 [Bacteroidales bacterium]|nr:hypothetical protein [Bacteroidales bacterium]
MNKFIEYGIRGEIPADAAESRIIPFILSTSKRDRHGTVLNQDNWQLDNYRKNPIIAYQHNLTGGLCSEPNPDNIIGKSLRVDVEGIQGGRMLVADAQFEDGAMNPLAEKVWRKLLFGSLSRSSVGFVEVGKGHYGTGEEARGAQNETYYFHGQELVEWSVVATPSNPDTGKREISMRKLREEAYVAIMYAFRELGGKFRLSQLEEFTVRDILDLLDGKDIDIKEKDPGKVRAILAEPEAQVAMLQRQMELRKLKLKALKAN